MTLTVLSSGIASASDIKVELKGSYFNPSKTIFKQIYGGGLTYGAEASSKVWKGIEAWIGVKYFARKGELTFTKERTRLNILPIGAGVRYSYPVSERVNIYGGLGLSHYQYKESNPIGKVSKGGWGFESRLGSFVRVVKGWFIDIYMDLSYCRMKPADFKIQIGGIEAGIGIGYNFLKNK